jgi:hypothetical protein
MALTRSSNAVKKLIPLFLLLSFCGLVNAQGNAKIDLIAASGKKTNWVETKTIGGASNRSPLDFKIRNGISARSENKRSQT